MSPRSGNRPCLLVASNGGHLLELIQVRELFAIENRHWVTFETTDAASLLAGEKVTYAHHPTNRNVGNLIRNTALAFTLLRRLRPAFVITTGAGVAVPFCYLGRSFGARVIYIESLARVSELSLTGRLVRPVVHRLFVQWPTLAARTRKAEFRGMVF